jgi:hypothetical protein
MFTEKLIARVAAHGLARKVLGLTGMAVTPSSPRQAPYDPTMPYLRFSLCSFLVQGR